MALRPVLRRRTAFALVGLSVVALTTLIGAAAPASADAPTVQEVTGTATLAAIFCQDVADCIAVGDDVAGNPVVVTITGGQAGSPTSVPGDSVGVQLRGIACTSPDHCIAVGNTAAGSANEGSYLVPVDDGVAGTPVPAPGAGVLDTIACPTTSQCLAGGSANSAELIDVAVSVVGGKTVPVPADPQIPPGTPDQGEGIISVSGIACATSTTCYGVFAGVGSGGAGVFPIVDGQAQTVTPYLNYDLDIACPTAQVCYAAGGALHVITNGTPVTVAGSGGVEVRGVACYSATACAGLGTGGVGVPFVNDRFGPAQDVPGVDRFTAVACPSSSVCYGVGYTGTSGVLATLAPATSNSPSDANVAPGSDATFTVQPTGDPTPTVQWQRSDDSGATFDDIDGADSASYTVSAATLGQSGQQFRAVVDNAVGEVITDAATLTVTGTSPAITSADHTTFVASVPGGQFSVTTTGIPTPTISESGPLPGGVTFTDNGDGTATIAGEALTHGSYPVTLTASNGVQPDATQDFTLTIAAASTTTVLTTSDSTVAAGASLELTATVGPTAANEATPTGSVEFFDGPTSLGSGQVSDGGITAFATNTLAPGSHSLTAVYSGDATFAGSTSAPVTVLVTQPPAITSGDSTSFTVGTPGTFTITTTGTPTPTITETGPLPAAVTLTDNGDGTATLSGTATATGAYPVTVTATNDADPDATQTFTLTVAPAGTTTALTATPTSITVGDPVTLTATVSPVGPNAVTPTGSVEFFDGTTSLGTATLTGTTATLSTSDLAVGDRTLTAAYSGDADFTASSSPPADVTVAGIAPAITSADTTEFTIGAVGTFTVTTTGNPDAALTESGALPDGVSFTDNGDGTATLTGTPTPGTAGSYPITLTASNGVQPDATQTLTLTIDKAGSTASLVTDPTHPRAGDPITLTATVVATDGSVDPSGEVEFFDGTTSLGTSDLVGDPTATLRVPALTAGAHTLTATYGGDAQFAASTSSPLRLVVAAAPSSPPASRSTGTTSTGTAPDSTGSGTADTGAPSGQLLMLAGLTMLVGLVLIRLGRRPRRQGAHRG